MPSASRRLGTALATLAAIGALALSSSAALADAPADKATARELFYEASNAMKAGDNARAAELFARSDRLHPTPTAALGAARALVQLGRLVEANERYQTILNRPLPDGASNAFRDAVESARSESVSVRESVPGLVIVVEEGLVADVQLDGESVPAAALGTRRPVDPGKHRVTAAAEGRAPFAQEVRVGVGETREVRVRFEAGGKSDTRAVLPTTKRESPTAPVAATLPDGRSDGSMQRTAGWLLVGVGGAGLVAWSITGVVYLVDENTVAGECDELHRCSPAGIDAADRARTVGVINTFALFGGLAATGAGLILALTAPDDKPRVSIRPAFTTRGGWLGVEGRL